jgi:serine/threonine protein kinase
MHDHTTTGSAQLQRLDVRSESGRVSQRTVLVTNTGNHYEIVRLLKETIYGQVYHAIRLNRDEAAGMLVRSSPVAEVAIKTYMKDRLIAYQGRTQENPKTELSAQAFIKRAGGHTNIIEQLDCCHDRDYLFQVMTFCDGYELYDYVEEHGALSEGRARFFFRQIIHGLKFLHSLHIGHRDMSLENVMVGQDGTCKIIDFGMCLQSARTAEGNEIYMPSTLGACGKKNYIAPEVLNPPEPHFSPKRADIWATGIMLFILGESRIRMN